MTGKHVYRAVVLDVVDGDTVHLAVRLRRSRAANGDLGFHVYDEDGWLTVHESFRLEGCDAAEKRTALGRRAIARVVELLPAGSLVTVASKRPKIGQERYGRWLATITTAAGVELPAELIVEGLAAPWDGRGSKPVQS